MHAFGNFTAAGIKRRLRSLSVRLFRQMVSGTAHYACPWKLCLTWDDGSFVPGVFGGSGLLETETSYRNLGSRPAHLIGNVQDLGLVEALIAQLRLVQLVTFQVEHLRSVLSFSSLIKPLLLKAVQKHINAQLISLILFSIDKVLNDSNTELVLLGLNFGAKICGGEVQNCLSIGGDFDIS